MNFESAWKIFSLALALIACGIAWVCCALSGGDLFECVLRAIMFFAGIWFVLSLLGALLRQFMISGRQE